MSARRKRGFTLLEVMVAVAILAVGLSAVFSSEAGSIRAAQRARKMGLATLLVRCKMGEIEEDMAVKGLPAVFATGKDKCCKDAPIEGYTCKWEIKPIVLPDTMFGDDDKDKDKDKKPGASGSPMSGNSMGPGMGAPGATGTGTGTGSGVSGLIGAASAALGFNKKGGSDTGNLPPELGKDGKPIGKDGKDSKDGIKDPNDKRTKEDPKDLLSGDPSRLMSNESGGEVDAITAMAMQFIYPVLKPAFQSQIRRATVTISWPEGDTFKWFDVTQYIVAEQPVPLSTDPNNPNALPGATGTTGTTTGSTTGTTTGTVGK